MTTIVTKNIADVDYHPMNSQIYPASYMSGDIKESIESHGQLTPITINSNNIIISGNRRVKAMRELGLQQVEAIVIEYSSPEDEIMAIIAYNNTRKKSIVESLNEIKIYREMWGKKQGQRTDLISANADRTSTRDLIAKAIGFSSANVHKIEFINNNVPALLSFINSGEYSIDGAYKEAKKIVKPKEADLQSSEFTDSNSTNLNVENTAVTAKSNAKTKPKAIKQGDENLVVYTVHVCPDCGHKFTNE